MTSPCSSSSTCSPRCAAPGSCARSAGVKGGYSFAKPSDEVTVLELVELLDGPLGTEATSVFAAAAEAARAVLSGATVASVAEDEVRSLVAPMYHI